MEANLKLLEVFYLKFWNVYFSWLRQHKMYDISYGIDR